VRIFIVGMLFLHLLFFVGLRERIQRGYPDFTATYTAATMLRRGQAHSLYDERAEFQTQAEFAGNLESRRGPLPYIHPPFEALVFLPLAYLPYHVAFVVWDSLSVLALLGVALVLRRHTHSLASIPPWEFVLGCLAFFPVFVTLLQGQDSILLLLLCALGFNALKKDAQILAGGWLAMGTFKFQIMVPLVLLVVLRRRKVAGGFVGVSLILASLSLALVGWDQVLRYPGFAVRGATVRGLGAVPAALMPNLRGLITGWPSNVAPAILQGVVIAGSAALLLLAALRGRPGRARQLNLQFSLAIIVVLLVGWYVNAHDLSLLVLPVALLADYCRSSFENPAGRRWALLAPMVPILISPLWILLWLKYGKINLMAIPLLWWAGEIGREISRAGDAAAEG
jgi:hypothetical protein